MSALLRKHPLAVWPAGIGLTIGILIAAIYVAGWILMLQLRIPLQLHTNWIWITIWHAYPKLHHQFLYHSAELGLAAAISPGLLLLKKPQRSPHGDAKFATERQVRRARLTADKGIIVGKRGRRYLIFGGQQHVLMSAPTRSGKGVGIVIPNLLNWPDSVVVLDIKQENWELTSEFRKRAGQACFLFNPAAEDLKTHRYNPLGYISEDPRFRVNDIQKIAAMLYPHREGLDPIWSASCRSLFLGVVLTLLETPGLPVTLGQVLRTVLNSEDLSVQFTKLIREREGVRRPFSPVCISALNDFIGVSSDKTRSSIQKSFTAPLEPWLNPIIDAATSFNDFDLRNLRRNHISLYVGVTPDNLERLQPIINLLFQQVIDLNTRVRPEQDSKLALQCLLLMDEFTAIGKIEALSKGIGYIAGYNLRMLPIIQSPAQVRHVYGHDAAETFLVNHALRVIFAPGDFGTAREISESLGFETMKGTTITQKKGLLHHEDQSVSINQQPRALLMPQEVRDLGPNRALLLLEGTPPILADKIRYFEDPAFTKRVLTPKEPPRLLIGGDYGWAPKSNVISTGSSAQEH